MNDTNLMYLLSGGLIGLLTGFMLDELFLVILSMRKRKNG